MFRKAHNSIVSDDMKIQLIIAEYESIRAESLQSFSTSQSIIQWSLASYGVLFGAGLLAMTSDLPDDAVELTTIACLVLFGVLLPGLISAAAWQWLGEITRMERAGVYLRGLERVVARWKSNDSFLSPISALGWETFLSGPVHSRKKLAPYLGTAAMFFGAILSSIFFAMVWQLPYYDLHWNEFPSIFWFVAYAGALALFLGVSISMGVAVLSLGGKYYDFASGQLQPNGRFGHPVSSYCSSGQMLS